MPRPRPRWILRRGTQAPARMARILIVDDEAGVREMIAIVLRRDGHETLGAADLAGAMAALADKRAPDAVISDLRMDGGDGLELLARIRQAHPDTPVALMTAYAEWDTGVAAMRQGAFTLIRKPFDNTQLRSVVARMAAAHDRFLAARAAGEARPGIHLVGSSDAIIAVTSMAERVAPTDATVLITGESGTGKELVASAIHYAGLRADGPFVRINSGALAPGVVDSELFGHLKGAFTGAHDDRPGLFALADQGTLFLDEVGELAPDTQVRLLRVLESGEYLPVGGREARRCDVRVIAATNRDLRAMVQAGTFREDLYYRLAVVPIHLPGLRERRSDIPLLAGHLLARHAVKLRRGVKGFTPAALAAMERWPWPGNVRELDNRIQRGVALTTDGLIDAEALFGDERPGQAAGGGSGAVAIGGRLERLERDVRAGTRIDLATELHDAERRLYAAALATTGDNLTAAADLLGLSFRQVRYQVRQLGLRT